MKKLAAIIFADEFCSGKCRFNPLFSFGAESVLSRCVDLFWANDVRQIVVVGKKTNRKLEETAENSGAEVVYESDGGQGVLFSLMTGVREFQRDVSGFFILPVNRPLVRAKTVTRLIQAFEKEDASILYPRFQGKRGYPPLVHSKLVPRMLEHTEEETLCTLLSRFDSEASDMDVVDRGVLRALETAEDYSVARQHVGLKYPFPDECEQLWNMYSTPHETREHCRAVARVSVRFCDMLNGQRFGQDRLDRCFVEGAALTHDVGKGLKRHDAIGGEWLAIHGFEDAADIVRHHSDLVLLPGDPITEKEIVFLADKLIHGVTPVSLDERYGDKMARYGHIPDARRAITGRHKRGKQVLRRFERELGIDPEALTREILSGCPVAEHV